jgi:hypothetical protein
MSRPRSRARARRREDSRRRRSDVREGQSGGAVRRRGVDPVEDLERARAVVVRRRDAVHGQRERTRVGRDGLRDLYVVRRSRDGVRQDDDERRECVAGRFREGAAGSGQQRESVRAARHGDRQVAVDRRRDRVPDVGGRRRDADGRARVRRVGAERRSVRHAVADRLRRRARVVRDRIHGHIEGPFARVPRADADVVRRAERRCERDFGESAAGLVVARDRRDAAGRAGGRRVDLENRVQERTRGESRRRAQRNADVAVDGRRVAEEDVVRAGMSGARADGGGREADRLGRADVGIGDARGSGRRRRIHAVGKRDRARAFVVARERSAVDDEGIRVVGSGGAGAPDPHRVRGARRRDDLHVVDGRVVAVMHGLRRTAGAGVEPEPVGSGAAHRDLEDAVRGGRERVPHVGDRRRKARAGRPEGRRRAVGRPGVRADEERRRAGALVVRRTRGADGQVEGPGGRRRPRADADQVRLSGRRGEAHLRSAVAELVVAREGGAAARARGRGVDVEHRVGQRSGREARRRARRERRRAGARRDIGEEHVLVEVGRPAATDAEVRGVGRENVGEGRAADAERRRRIDAVGHDDRRRAFVVGRDLGRGGRGDEQEGRDDGGAARRNCFEHGVSSVDGSVDRPPTGL